MKKPPKFDKYDYYSRSVQDTDKDVKFLLRAYKSAFGRNPRVLREDFCGTFQLCRDWVKKNPSHRAIGVDLDPEPVAYGKTHFWHKLDASEQKRLELVEGNVLSAGLPAADIVVAMNFSYFIFKERATLLSYFRRCQQALRRPGMLVLDCFGGLGCMKANEESTDFRGFTYFWDQANFNPINNHSLFYIHYKRKGEGKRREKVFTYDWRMWSIAELRDLLDEAGFRRSHVYWEGSNSRGEGNGIYSKRETEENCDTWLVYIVAEK